MSRASSGLAIALAVAIGAGVTWWWTKRGVESPAADTVATQAVAAPPETYMPAETPPPPTTSRGASAARAAPSSAQVTGVQNDSTYERMLASAQTDPRSASAVRDLIQNRERFLFTVDDPEWARATEQTLRAFLQSKSVDTGVEITSVACRSAGCEVQALLTPFCGGRPCELQMQGEPPPPSEVRIIEHPLTPLRMDRPADLPLQREALISQSVGDRMGVMVTYSREKPAAEGFSR